MLGDGNSFARTDSMNHHRKWSACRNSGIFLTQRPSCCVSGISEALLAFFFDGIVKFIKCIDREEDFSTNFKYIREATPLKLMGHRCNRSDIERDIFTSHTISTSECSNQFPFLVEQIDCQAIDLHLTEPGIGYATLFNSIKPEIEFIDAKDIVERHHLFDMVMLGEMCGKAAAH